MHSFVMRGFIYTWTFSLDVSATQATVLSKKYGVHPVVAKLLLQKGFEETDFDKFLKPTYDQLSSPFVFKEMETAVGRIKKAIDERERIVVYGDYDADGVCATAMLTKALNKSGADVIPYIPNRLEEGYGLCVENIKKLGDFSLIITVDNGVRSLNETEFVRSMGRDIIITDHHPPGPDLPNALAVINPHLEDGVTPFAGCGVAFQLLRGLEEKFGGFEPEKYLDITAIGTYADIVPLVGDNRIIVHEGLKKIASQNHAGITALLQIAGRKPENVAEYDLGFVLGPRLNSAGRKGDASAALEILSVFEDFKAASIFARELESYNDWRRNEMESIEKSARSMLENLGNVPPAIILKNQNWHLGILGLGASRLSENFNKPAILLKESGNLLKGSGRSPSTDFDMIRSLEKCSDLLKIYGGHSQAVGLTMEKDRFDEFKELFYSIVSKNDSFEKKIVISGEYVPAYDDFSLFEDMSKLAPFGHSNEKPLFLASDVVFEEVKEVGTGHLKATLLTKRGKIDSIGFGLGNFQNDIRGKKGDLIYTLNLNYFNGKKKIQANIKDFRTENL
ncbi:single-stranded-DNA-specific exonuclease RecJ [candidate division WOR-3 bacterium]|nr:single-stranded-DNA-specific exonuclease RecJ [candidate division WOR-3 bacterium]